MPLPCGPPISQLRSCPLIVSSHPPSYSPYPLYVSKRPGNSSIGGARPCRALQNLDLAERGAATACARPSIVHNAGCRTDTARLAAATAAGRRERRRGTREWDSVGGEARGAWARWDYWLRGAGWRRP